MPPITLYFLQASRAIRTAWLLEELSQPYELKFFDREKEKAPLALKEASGNPLGKSPTILDGDITVYESGAITEYLIGKYDGVGKGLMGRGGKENVQVLQWIHAAEGTFLLHALAITYARWTVPAGVREETKKGLAVNVWKDLDWLEAELAKSNSGWLVGGNVTAADIMVHFSIQFIFARGLGVEKGAVVPEGLKKEGFGKWKGIAEWMVKCEHSGGYRKAVDTTGYTLFPSTGVNWK